jgi:hypothetical protein
MQIKHDGRTQTASAWAVEIGISYHALRWRLRHWETERALRTPKRPHNKLLTHDGRTQKQSDWLKELGITRWGLRDRLERGETLAEALSGEVGWKRRRTGR